MSRVDAYRIVVAVTLWSIGACSADRPGSGAGEAREPAAVSAANRGELLALACQACHALTPAGGADIGPSLYGVFGRPAAGLNDFEYSDALRNAQFQWTAQRLDAWLLAPTQFLPGTTMVFAGYADEQDRRDLIAWLQSATAPVVEHGAR